MVLGKKKKKGMWFQVDYIVSVIDIKPWPPSVALCSVQSVLIQWQNGEQNTGFLPPGAPSLNGFDDGKIEFNEFFKLQVTLIMKNKGFHKNYLEFHLYEPKKDKAIKGQLLGTGCINLSDYGVIKDTKNVSVPIVIKKGSYKGMIQPNLYLQIQPFDNEGIESILRMVNEHCEDDSELTSFTDDEEGTSNSHSFKPTLHFDNVLSFANVDLSSDPTDYGRAKTFRENGDVFSRFSDVATARKQTSRSTSTLKFGKKGLQLHGFGDKLKNVKSARFSTDSPRAAIGPLTAMQFSEKLREESYIKEVAVDAKSQEMSEKKEKKEKKNKKPDDRAELVSRIEMLEKELREVAVIEVALYSVSAEHLNSKRKVHAPARRLCRFYRHVCEGGSESKRASCARSIISGLVLISKASANDVSRLTFWLSNAIILRAMVSQITEELLASTELTSSIESKSGRKKSEKKCSKNDITDGSDDWGDPLTFIMALEKIEAWIFSCIVEGVWWQSFTPHMHPAKKTKKGKRLSTKKTQKWRFGLGDQEQGTFSIELWKKAFQDACERLCPIRAGGHDCGCLPMLSKMAMEQLVDRLDVAMFNAILRDSEDEMPTDPMSDPISEPKVLPIPAGKSSFGAGAQLKFAVVNWSKCLNDFFSFDDHETSKDQNTSNNETTNFKAFHLLNALGNLLMLPLGMLSDANTRKEVCPILGTPLVKRVFANFVPDDFSPNPIPEEVLEALDSEDSVEDSDYIIKSFPCPANTIVYSPLPTELFSSLLDKTNQGHHKTGSSLLRKSHNSDDELDKINTPLAMINVQNICITPKSSKPNWMPQGKGGQDALRYKLLQEAWKNGS